MRLLFLCLVLLVAGCTEVPDWGFEVGDKVEHGTGLKGVVVRRWYGQHQYGNEQYEIRYYTEEDGMKKIWVSVHD